MGAATALCPFRVLSGAGSENGDAVLVYARRDVATAVIFRLNLS